jgi:hypothetical protein
VQLSKLSKRTERWVSRWLSEPVDARCPQCSACCALGAGSSVRYAGAPVSSSCVRRRPGNGSTPAGTHSAGLRLPSAGWLLEGVASSICDGAVSRLCCADIELWAGTVSAGLRLGNTGAREPAAAAPGAAGSGLRRGCSTGLLLEALVQPTPRSAMLTANCCATERSSARLPGVDGASSNTALDLPRASGPPVWAAAGRPQRSGCRESAPVAMALPLAAPGPLAACSVRPDASEETADWPLLRRRDSAVLVSVVCSTDGGGDTIDGRTGADVGGSLARTCSCQDWCAAAPVGTGAGAALAGSRAPQTLRTGAHGARAGASPAGGAAARGDRRLRSAPLLTCLGVPLALPDWRELDCGWTGGQKRPPAGADHAPLGGALSGVRHGVDGPVAEPPAAACGADTATGGVVAWAASALRLCARSAAGRVLGVELDLPFRLPLSEPGGPEGLAGRGAAAAAA